MLKLESSDTRSPYWVRLQRRGIEVLGEEKKILNTVYAESTFAEVEAVCEKNGISLAEYVKDCEGSEIIEYIKLVWQRMKQTAENGLRAEGIIPEGLGIKRKAARLFKKGQCVRQRLHLSITLA